MSELENKKPIGEVFELIAKILNPNMASIILMDRAAYAADEDSGLLEARNFYIDSGAFDTQELLLNQQSVENDLEKMVRAIQKRGYSREEAYEFLVKNMVHLENPSEKVKKKRKSA